MCYHSMHLLLSTFIFIFYFFYFLFVLVQNLRLLSWAVWWLICCVYFFLQSKIFPLSFSNLKCREQWRNCIPHQYCLWTFRSYKHCVVYIYIYIFQKKKKKKQRVEEQENANPCLINEIEIADRALLPYHFGVKWRTYQLVQGVLCP
jgi:hypothetical protein